MRTLATARKYLARIAVGALLASSTVTCSDDSTHSPTGGAGKAGESGESGEGGLAGESGAEAGASASGGGSGNPSGGKTGEAGSSAGNDGTSGHGGSVGGASGGTSGGGTSGGGTSGGGTSGGGTSGGGTSGGGMSGGGMSGGGTSGGGVAGGGTSSAGGGSGGIAGGGVGGTSGGGVAGGGTSGAGGGSGGIAGGGGTGGGVGGGGTSSGGGAGGTSGNVCPSQLCSTPWSTENCGPDCGPIASAQCLACEAAGTEVDCKESYCSLLGNTVAVTGSAAAGQSRLSLCNQVLACLQKTGCSLHAANPTELVASCYCGSVAFAECTPQNANGLCRAEFEKGFEVSSPTAIADPSVFFDDTRGGGMAYYRTQCETDNHCEDACFHGQ